MKNVEMPLTSSNIQDYLFCRVPFGVISSPFLLGARVDRHLDSYSSDIERLLKRDIYMDNVITGAKSKEESMLFYDTSKRIFSEASMNLSEWITKSDEFNDTIPVYDRAGQKTIKVLALSWNTVEDTIRLKRDLGDTCVTKRDMLKQGASVFYPLGLFSSITLRGKLLLQNIWMKKLDWDDPIDESEIKVWSSLKEDLFRISDLKVRICVSIQGKDALSNLLCFCDASTRAYSTNIYLEQQSDDERKSELIFSKTRIAPTYGSTTPRLELIALLIGVRSFTVCEGATTFGD